MLFLKKNDTKKFIHFNSPSMVEENLKKQAPGPEFTGSVMDILNKIEESANRIKDIKYVQEGAYYSSEPSLSSIEQKLPGKCRRESDNFIEIRDSETIWRYDKIDRHCLLNEV